jgi:rSAM/selenodomain-associated transferase 1
MRARARGTRGHLVVFARRPRLGRVKRRLAAGIGAPAALRLYRRLLARTLARLGRLARWRCWLAVTPDRETAGWPRPWRPIGQGSGDLGRRMARPLGRRAPGRLPPGPVVIVGSDIPDLGRRHALAAFAALGRADLVFGPAEDGGYWLVGLSARARILDPFRGVRWSTAHALADTRANLDGRWRVALLERLADLDEPEDLKRLVNSPGSSVPA